MNAESCDCEDIDFPAYEGELHILNDFVINSDYIRIFMEFDDMITFRLYKLHDLPDFPISLEEMSNFTDIECLEIMPDPTFTENYAQLSLRASEGNCSWSVNYNGPDGSNIGSLTLELIVWPENEPEFLGELLLLDEVTYPYVTTLLPGDNITARLM
jgi:hypothetical protein